MLISGPLLPAVSAIATATALLWRSCQYPRASGVLRCRDVLVHIPAILQRAAAPHYTWITGRSRLRLDGRVSLAAGIVGASRVTLPGEAGMTHRKLLFGAPGERFEPSI